MLNFSNGNCVSVTLCPCACNNLSLITATAYNRTLLRQLQTFFENDTRVRETIFNGGSDKSERHQFCHEATSRSCPAAISAMLCRRSTRLLTKGRCAAPRRGLLRIPATLCCSLHLSYKYIAITIPRESGRQPAILFSTLYLIFNHFMV